MATQSGAAESTTKRVADHTQLAGRTARRLLLALLAVVVLLGASGLLGVHSAQVSDSANGFTVTLVYPQVARGGLDVRWQVTVTHPGGFDADIVLAVTADYFDLFETQGFHPTPDAETADAQFLYLTFTKPPSGEVFRVDFDAYIQPASQRGRSAELRLLVGGRTQVSVDYRTWLVP
ncbi:MAG: hypothetical protein H0T66_06725 [Geodermatophilaceae bacterium]|nr:hypothetical protein [Geodermatophilaceae bacterium]MDQ3455045.1 hypothetical protein [Actinomycetota bacterium]